MSKFPSKHTTAFSFEGRFLGFVFEDGYKLKYMRIEAAEGELCIKLAKYLRSSFELRLSVGDLVQVAGERKLYPETGKIKLKAERVVVVSANPVQASVSSPVLESSEPREHSLKLSATKPAKTKASILVCQKSDCMKRGGKAVCQALEAALSERGIEDQVAIQGTGCLKQCKAGPNIVVTPDKTRYSRIQADQIPEVIDKHFPTSSQSETLTLTKI